MLGNETVEVRETFFCDNVDRDGDANAVGNAACSCAQVGNDFVVQVFFAGGQELRREPQLSLRLMLENKILHNGIKIGENFKSAGE